MSKSFDDLKLNIASGSLDKVRAQIDKSKRKKDLKNLSEEQIEELEKLLNNTTVINGEQGERYKQIRELVTEYIKEMRENNHQKNIILELINDRITSQPNMLFSFPGKAAVSMQDFDEWEHVEKEEPVAEDDNSWIPNVLKKSFGL